MHDVLFGGESLTYPSSNICMGIKIKRNWKINSGWWIAGNNKSGVMYYVVLVKDELGERVVCCVKKGFDTVMMIIWTMK